MRVFVESRDFRKKVGIRKGTVSELLRSLNATDERFIVSRKGKMLVGDDKLADGDRIKLHPVVSGG